MKKVYGITGLNCSNCAAKIQHQIKNLINVKDCNINLYKQKITLDIDKNTDLTTFLITINDIADKIEKGTVFQEIGTTTLKNKDCKCSDCHCEESNHSHHGHSHSHSHSHNDKKGNFNLENTVIFLGIFLFIVSFFIPNKLIKTSVLLVAYAISGYDILYHSLANIKRGNFLDENFLMSIATIGAIALGEYREALGVMIFYKIGEAFQDKAVDNSKKSIESLVEMKATYANLKLEDGSIKKVNPDSLELEDSIVIKAGEKVPTDCVVINGSSMIDTSALTGESLPISIEKGMELLSGSINLDGMIEARVTKKYKDSAVSKIIEMVENATDKKANSEKFITRFARYYTPIVVLVACLVAFIIPIFVGNFSVWFGRALIFLVISCPCALVLSVPLTFFSSIGLSSKRGILIKGGNYLEVLSKTDTVVFDKTGTLTKGEFKIEHIDTEENYTASDVIEIGKAGEYYSNHPIGKAILNYKDVAINEKDITDYKEISGKGVNAKYKGKNILVGNLKLMNEYSVNVKSCKDGNLTTVYIAIDNNYIGAIHLADEIKDDAIKTIKALRKMNMNIYMLTGDNKNIGTVVGEELGLNKENVFAGLLPEDKVNIIKKLKKKSKGIVFVGDGINDAPAISLSDVGVAMGGVGSDVAVETADIVLVEDEPYKIVETLKIAKENKKVVYQNIYFSLGVKILVMILGVLGIANMWMAIFADVGVSVIAVLNASKVLKFNKF